ncbi:MAG: hypothetical protein HY934_08325 [Candidatus Firestonebacteria bacterium]|nr:hypothetical protein [Candidatus Firestonebacteria bacterium]
MIINKKSKFKFFYYVSIFILCLTITSIKADDAATSGRNIASKWENITIIIKITIKQKVIMQGKEVYNTESKMEINGTVMDSTGLVVASLSETDPSSLVENFLHGVQDDRKPKYESDITDIKIRFSKDNEVPAKIVLRDKDMDLVFIRPTNRLKDTVQFINFKDSIQPELLDRILCLYRLGKVADEVLSINISRIQAVVNKPRTFYVPDDMNCGLGIPVFSLEKEKIIGILVVRMTPSHSDNAISMFSRKNEMMPLPIILPASEIKEVSVQVPPYE